MWADAHAGVEQQHRHPSQKRVAHPNWYVSLLCVCTILSTLATLLCSVDRCALFTTASCPDVWLDNRETGLQQMWATQPEGRVSIAIPAGVGVGIHIAELGTGVDTNGG